MQMKKTCKANEKLTCKALQSYHTRGMYMAKKRREKVEFRYYEMPQNMPVLALLGEKWRQVYGRDVDYLHFHNFLEIGYCYYGEGELILEEETFHFEKESFSVIPKNHPHTTTSDAGSVAYWEYLFLDIEGFLHEAYKNDSMFAEEMIRRVSKRAYYSEIREFPQMAAVIRSIIEAMRQKEEMYLETVKGLIYVLLIEIARQNPTKETRVKPNDVSATQIVRALDYMSDCYDAELRIGDLADICHMSETHFRRVFHESMNMTPGEYLNLVRIQMACEFMKKSGLSMLEIGERVGFTTPSTFNRNFRKYVGMSPYQWKNNPDNYEGKLLNYKISALKGW